jgi:Concanavalin A-like lectin/glucanases superfamily
MRIPNPNQKPPLGSPLLKGNFPTPLGAWLLNEGAGTATMDSSANRNNAKLVNAPQWSGSRSDSPIGGMLKLANGSNQYLSVPPAPHYEINKYTICMGVVPLAVQAARGLFYKGAGGGTWGSIAFHQHTAGVLSIRINNNGTNLTGNQALQAGVHYHIATSIGVDGLKLYINGKLDASGAGAAVTPDGYGLVIGGYYNLTGFDYDGGITYCIVYPEILDQRQIAKIACDPFLAWRPSIKSYYVPSGGAPAAGYMTTNRIWG